MGILYRSIVRPILFRFDAERVHNAVLRQGERIGRGTFSKKFVSLLCGYQHPALCTRVCGIEFQNPVGLAAGFDKNARLTGVLGSVGFGFSAVGSITAEPCAGNPAPRLWRLPRDKAIAVHYGLANDGAEAVARRLNRAEFSLPVGISIAKTNKRGIMGQDAVEDYAKSFSLLAPYADYLEINISCPNTPDGRDFSDQEALRALLLRLDRPRTEKPVFLKLAADLSPREFDAILEACRSYTWIKGFVISNLTHRYDHLKTDAGDLKRREVRGGVSGRAVWNISNDLLAHAYRRAGREYVFAGCGGIFSGEDAYHKIRLGASLVELITGMIYEGPTLVRRINKELVRLLWRDGLRNISEAVGAAHRA